MSSSSFTDLSDAELRDRFRGTSLTCDRWYAEAMVEPDKLRRERYTILHDRAGETLLSLAFEIDRREAERNQGRLFTEAA